MGVRNRSMERVMDLKDKLTAVAFGLPLVMLCLGTYGL